MIKKPEWLRVPFRDDQNSRFTADLIREMKLNTVCVEANCPNRSECFSNKTATFMILGTNCTRKCSFCNVNFGEPQMIDKNEPVRIAEAVKALGLRYIVITSVTRDDLQDGGAGHYANVIREIKRCSPDTDVEVLIPDLPVLECITKTSPAVISHNLETVESLYCDVRPGADYYKSLDVLRKIKKIDPCIHTKSGIMLGLGETHQEVIKTFDDLLEAGCEILTIGQYLSPSEKHYPVREYITPEVFSKYGETARKRGFRYAASAPFVRSSYHAGTAYYSVSSGSGTSSGTVSCISSGSSTTSGSSVTSGS